MKSYDNRRKVSNNWQAFKHRQSLTKTKMIMPKKDIAVFIREGLIVYTNDASKIEEIKLRYADKW